ncbi:MAG: proton-conducting transporter membrane subunit, partial [Pseudomonadota bacterium]
ALYRMHSCKVADWSGLARKMPFTMAAFVIGGLSMVGVPGTAGFITKWNLAIGALELGYWWLVGLIMLSSFIAFFYIGRVIEIAWMRAPVSDLDDARPPPLSMTFTMFLLAVAVIWFGFETTFSLDLARDAARYLLAGGGLS